MIYIDGVKDKPYFELEVHVLVFSLSFGC
jgi:hypothetical protein